MSEAQNWRQGFTVGPQGPWTTTSNTPGQAPLPPPAPHPTGAAEGPRRVLYGNSTSASAPAVVMETGSREASWKLLCHGSAEPCFSPCTCGPGDPGAPHPLVGRVSWTSTWVHSGGSPANPENRLPGVPPKSTSFQTCTRFF